MRGTRLKHRSIRGRGLIALSVCAIIGGVVGMRPGTAHAANASIGAGGTGATARFTPNTQTVNVGDTVTFVWTSGGASGHNAIATTGGLPTLTLTQAAPNASWTAAAPGTYYFYCSIHTSAANATEGHVVANDAMVGKLVVVASGAPAPNPGPTQGAPALAVPAKTGSAGLATPADSTGAVMALGALALLAVAGGRLVTRRQR